MSDAVSSPIAEPVPTMGSVAPPPRPSLPLKNIAMVLFVVALIGLIVAAIYFFIVRRNHTPEAGDTPRQISLVYWGLWEETQTLESVINEFEAQNPGVTIEYSQQSPRDYRERLESAFARGQGPDIFRYHATWAKVLDQKGLVAPVPASVVSSTKLESDFYPHVKEDLRASSGYVGIPLMTDGLALYVNKRMLQTTGRSAPTTWDELRSLARQLTVYGNNNAIEQSGAAVGGANNIDHFSDVLGVLIFQNGGNPGIVDDLVRDALIFYTQFMREDKVWDEKLPNSTYAFAIEKTAMIFAPSWRAFEVKQINPNFEFDIVPIPQLPGKPVTWSSYWVEGVAKSSKEQEMAWKFLEFMARKETLQKLYDNAASTRLFGELYPRVEMAPMLANDKYAGAYIRQAPDAKSWYMSSRTFDNGVNDEIIKYYQDAVNGLNTGKRIEEVLPILTQGINQVLQKYGLGGSSAPIVPLQ